MSGPLRIFPAYGLDNSLLTAVLVGLYIRFAFNEWLGWVFSGLVVPGYLAAIILLRPASAFMIVIEAAVTLLAVRSVSSVMSLTKLGTPMFGRDRFVWLVVVGVGVRILFEVHLAPFVESWFRVRQGFDPGDSFGLYGIGLVLVPLLANACWKPGLVRGGFQQIVCTGATYFLLQLLLTTTNLSFAGVAENFDQIALQLNSSPKAYLLLLTGVLLASRANLRFGWDTSGVLIPGLLGLSFFAPTKVLATVGESLVIALAAYLFVRLPRVRDWNLEGPRRVVMLFSLGYVVKSIIIAVFGATIPSFTATELFGIGYLLPSLLALKIWQRRNPATVLVPTLTLSLAGFTIGSLIGYQLVVGNTWLQAQRAATSRDTEACASADSLLSEVRLARARGARKLPSPTALRITGTELGALKDMLVRLRALTAQGVDSCPQLAEKLKPSRLGLRLQAATSPSGQLYFTLREHAEDAEHLRGFGLIAVAAKPHGGPLLVVERPGEDLTDMGALVSLSELAGADALVIGGLPLPALGRGDVRRDADVPLRAAVQSFTGPAIKIQSGSFAQPQLSGPVPAGLAQVLAAKLGPIVRTDPEQPSSELRLPPASEQFLAARLLPEIGQFESPGTWLAALLAVPQPTPVGPRAPATDQLLAEEIIRPLARAHEPGELLPLARRVAGAASELGLKVALVSGARPRIALSGNGEALLLSPGAPAGALLEVVSRRRGVAELATVLLDARDAHALLISVALPGTADAGPLGRVAAPILALTPPLPPVILIRAGIAATPDCSIITDPLPARAADSQLAQQLAETLRMFGIRSELRNQYDVDTVEPPSHLVSLLRVRAQGEFVTLRVGPEVRERFRPEPLTPAQLLLFTRLGVQTVHGPLAETLGAACAEPRLTTVPEELMSDARTFAISRHPVLIERLAARAQEKQFRLRVVDDQRQGEAYLLLNGERGAAAISLRPQKTPSVTLRCGQELAAQILQAQSVGAQSIEVQKP